MTLYIEEATISPVRTTAGKTTNYVAVKHDITARKKAEQEQESLARLPSENPNPVLRFAKDGKILYSNRAGEQLLCKWDTPIGEKVPKKWYDSITKAFEFNRNIEVEEKVKDTIFLIVIAL